jgi:hypothetical protein
MKHTDKFGGKLQRVDYRRPDCVRKRQSVLGIRLPPPDLCFFFLFGLHGAGYCTSVQAVRIIRQGAEQFPLFCSVQTAERRR